MKNESRIPDKDFLEILKAYLDTHFPTTQDAADHYQISRQYLSNITRGQKPPNKQMLKEMGYNRFKVAKYQKIDEPESLAIEESDFVEHIEAYMEARFESYPKAAEHYNMSRQYMSNIVNGDKPPNKQILKDMGYARSKDVYYERIGDDQSESDQAA